TIEWAPAHLPESRKTPSGGPGPTLPINVGFTRRAGLEAPVYPQVLLGMLADHLFQFGHVARRVGGRIAAGPATPLRFDAQAIAAVRIAMEPERQHHRLAAPGEFRGRGQGRGGDA